MTLKEVLATGYRFRLPNRWFGPNCWWENRNGEIYIPWMKGGLESGSMWYEENTEYSDKWYVDEKQVHCSKFKNKLENMINET